MNPYQQWIYHLQAYSLSPWKPSAAVGGVGHQKREPADVRGGLTAQKSLMWVPDMKQWQEREQAALRPSVLYIAVSVSLCWSVRVFPPHILSPSPTHTQTHTHMGRNKHSHTQQPWNELDCLQEKLRGQWKQKQDARENLSVQEEWSFHPKAATRNNAGVVWLSQATITEC